MPNPRRRWTIRTCILALIAVLSSDNYVKVLSTLLPAPGHWEDCCRRDLPAWIVLAGYMIVVRACVSLSSSGYLRSDGVTGPLER